DLRHQLRQRQADLIIRHGDPATEILTLARDVNATAVFIADDVSHYATRRREHLERECRKHRIDLTLTPGLTVVPPGGLNPASGSHYKAFTPYWRAWCATRWRPHHPAPDEIKMPDVEHIGRLPAAVQPDSPHLATGGETEGRRRFLAWRE